MKIGIIFSGYDSQFVGMAKDFYDDNRIIQDYFEEAYNCLNINFVKLCFASSDQELSKVQNAYLSIFLVNVSLFALLKEYGIKADLIAGYGIPGFYSSVYCANGFTFPDGLYLLRKFTTFYEDALPNMTDIGVVKIEEIAESKLKKICNTLNLNISGYNGNNEYIVTGLNSDILKLKEEKNNLNFKFKNVPLEPGLYSELLNEVAEQFKIYFEKVDFKDLQIPIISNINGKELLTSKNVRNDIVAQITHSNDLEKVLTKFADVDCIIEVGPKEVFTSQLKEIYPDKNILSFTKKADIEVVKNLLNNEVEVSKQEDKEINQDIQDNQDAK